MTVRGGSADLGFRLNIDFHERPSVDMSAASSRVPASSTEKSPRLLSALHNQYTGQCDAYGSHSVRERDCWRATCKPAWQTTNTRTTCMGLVDKCTHNEAIAATSTQHYDDIRHSSNHLQLCSVLFERGSISMRGCWQHRLGG